MSGQRGEMIRSGAAGRNPHTDLGPGPRDQSVGRLRDRGGVDADDRDRRLGPQPLCHRA